MIDKNGADRRLWGMRRDGIIAASRPLMAIAFATLLPGCHLFSRFSPDCHKPQEYQRAGEVAPLIVPAGLDQANTQGALVVPKVDNPPPRPGPKDACLDVPPKYKPAPSNKAGTQTN